LFILILANMNNHFTMMDVKIHVLSISSYNVISWDWKKAI